MLSERDLSLFRSGGPSYWAHLNRRLKVRLQALPRVYGIAGDEGDDIVQEAWARAWTCRLEFQNRGSLDGWIDHICRHLCRAHMRLARRQSLRTHSLAESLPPLMDDASAIRRGVYTQDVCDLVDDVIMAMPSLQRRVAALAWLLDYSTKVIASTLGVAQGTVKSELFRARGRLRNRLTNAGGSNRRLPTASA